MQPKEKNKGWRVTRVMLLIHVHLHGSIQRYFKLQEQDLHLENFGMNVGSQCPQSWQLPDVLLHTLRISSHSSVWHSDLS